MLVDDRVSSVAASLWDALPFAPLQCYLSASPTGRRLQKKGAASGALALQEEMLPLRFYDLLGSFVVVLLFRGVVGLRLFLSRLFVFGLR